MAIINPELDFNRIKLYYQENKHITIENFLSEEVAETVYQGFKDISRLNLWYQAKYGRVNTYQKNLDLEESLSFHFSYEYDMFPLKNHTKDLMLSSNISRPDINKIDRIADNPEMELHYSHPLRRIGNFLNSNEMHDLIRFITHEVLTDNKMLCFASRYIKDHFLSLHSDGTADDNFPRKIAFVLSLTKEWLVEWGGSLIFVDNCEKNIIKTLIPSFNTLTIFKVPSKHVVLPVSSYCQSERFSITGWYQKI